MIRNHILGLCFVLVFMASPVVAQTSGQAGKPTDIERRTGHARPAPRPGQPVFSIPTGIDLDDGMTEDEAVAVALWNNPTLHADLAALGLARADLLEAGLLRNPLIQAVLPMGIYSQFESLFTFPVDVLWQRRKRVNFAAAEVERVAVSLEQNALNLIRDTRIAYTDWRLALERVRLADEAVALRSETARLMDVRLKFGDVGEPEAVTARLDRTIAAEQVARSRHDAVLALNRLRGVLGLGDEKIDLRPEISSTVTVATANSGATPHENVDDLIRTAFASRPDLRAAELAIDVAVKRAKWERSRRFALSALFNIKRGDGLGFSPRPGILAELPLFFRNQGAISRADAEVERTAWQYVAVRQRVALDVRDAVEQLRQARESLAAYRDRVVPLARTTLGLATQAFERGDQSYLVVLDASRRLLDVRAREVELEAEVTRAQINLDRGIGRKADANP